MRQKLCISLGRNLRIEAQDMRQNQSIRQPMRDFIMPPNRIGQGMYGSHRRIGKGLPGQHRAQKHAGPSFKIIWFLYRPQKHAAHEPQRLDRKRTADWIVVGIDAGIGFNRMNHGINAGCSRHMRRQSKRQFRIKQRQIRQE